MTDIFDSVVRRMRSRARHEDLPSIAIYTERDSKRRVERSADSNHPHNRPARDKSGYRVVAYACDVIAALSRLPQQKRKFAGIGEEWRHLGI